MSHQDQDGRTAFAFHFQALYDAFLWLFKAADLSPIQFRDDCTWSPPGLIFTALLASRRDRAERSRSQEGQQPPDVWLTGHVARGDRPALGLANRAFRQQ